VSRVHFFATQLDFSGICQSVDSKLSLNVAACIDEPWRDDLADPAVYHRLADVPGLGLLDGNSSHRYSKRYLAVDRSVQLEIRKRHMGGTKYDAVLDASYYEGGVDVMPGGEYLHDGIVMGEILSQIATRESERIVRAFRTAMKKQFGHKTFFGAWVGPQALKRLRSGTARLTTHYEHPDHDISDVKLEQISPA